jgi:hypothetical protein
VHADGITFAISLILILIGSRLPFCILSCLSFNAQSASVVCDSSRESFESYIASTAK